MSISWDSPQTLKPKNASIMSISWDSPEPSGASGAPAETAANLVTPKPAHHEHQLGQPPNLKTQKREHHEHQLGQPGAFRSIRSTSRDCRKPCDPKARAS